MKLLIVAIPDSIHAARWVLQLMSAGWEIHFYPNAPFSKLREELRPHVDHSFAWRRYFRGKCGKGKIHYCGILNTKLRWPRNLRELRDVILWIILRYVPRATIFHLKRQIQKFKPDLVHSLEFQASGKMVLEAKQAGAVVRRWIATNYGSDVFLFGRLPWSKQMVVDILSSCDIYSCECERDIELARSLGFKGSFWPVMPNAGGFDLNEIKSVRERYAGKPRRLIMLKGYNGWSGRALFVIEALRKVRDQIEGFEIVLFSWTEDSRIALELLHQETEIPYRLIPHLTPHKTMLELYAQAHLYIGCGISDGVSTSCLEAMAMGAFPIQSKGACCNEWFRDGETGLSIGGSDIDEIANAIRAALETPDRVKRAEIANWRVVEERLDGKKIGRLAIENYLASVQPQTGMS